MKKEGFQREMAIKKFKEAKDVANKYGHPMSDERAARDAAGYCGKDVTHTQVLQWVRGS
jgi:hypothetical protein